MDWNPVIAIGRQFGSGGHEIGTKVARELGIPCYDRSLVDMASQELQVDQYDLEQVDDAADAIRKVDRKRKFYFENYTDKTGEVPTATM